MNVRPRLKNTSGLNRSTSNSFPRTTIESTLQNGPSQHLNIISLRLSQLWICTALSSFGMNFSCKLNSPCICFASPNGIPTGQPTRKSTAASTSTRPRLPHSEPKHSFMKTRHHVRPGPPAQPMGTTWAWHPTTIDASDSTSQSLYLHNMIFPFRWQPNSSRHSVWRCLQRQRKKLSISKLYRT